MLDRPALNNPEYASEPAHLKSLGRTRCVATAAEEHYIEIKHRVTLDFYIDDVLLSDEFLMVPGLSEEATIGAATMQNPERRTRRIKLDFEHDQVIVERNVAPPKLPKMQLI